MDGKKVQSAINMTMQIAETPLDDLQIAVISFSEKYSRWEGTQDLNPKTKKPMSYKNWSLMPSKVNLDKAFSWLQSNQFSGGTHLVPALTSAFNTTTGKDGHPAIKNLSIIIISDCEFYTHHSQKNPFAEIRAAILNGQKTRKKYELSPAAIGIFGIAVPDNMQAGVKGLVGKKKVIKEKEKLVIQWKVDLCSLGYCALVYEKD
jgi:hypothetical protein